MMDQGNDKRKIIRERTENYGKKGGTTVIREKRERMTESF
jgi:hypothetical protein